MTRLCTCDRFVLGGRYDVSRHCRLCWLFAHNQEYRDLWGDGQAGKAAVAPGLPIEPAPRPRPNCLHLGKRLELIPGCNGWRCRHDCTHDNRAAHPEGTPGGNCQTCPDYEADDPNWTETPTVEKVLIDFPHGLGDCVQLTAVLRHLRQHKPTWEIDVRCGFGRESLFTGLCRRAFHSGQAPDREYDRVIADGFPESPTETKTLRTLRTTYGITPSVELCEYEVRLQEVDLQAARDYFRSLGLEPWDGGRFPVVVAHYKGNSAACNKNLPDGAILPLADRCRTLGLRLVVLDFDERTDPIIRDHPAVSVCSHFTAPALWKFNGCGDAARIAALIELSTAWLGIDSGPGHVGGATSTPGVVVWTRHHPVRFYDYGMRHVLHLVPPDLDRLPPRRGGRSILDRYYRYQTYSDMGQDIAVAVLSNLAHREPPTVDTTDQPPAPGAAFRWGFWVPGDRPSQSWTIIEDVLIRDAYKTRLRPRKDGIEYVVDVGANVGAFARLWSERNPQARIACVEVHPALIPLLKANVPNAEVIHAACHYGTEPLYLLDSLSPVAVSKSTGGTRVVSHAEQEAEMAAEYVKPPDAVPTITLEQICERLGFPRIDVLKLDCEGSELDILAHCDLSKVGTVFVESHNPDRWRELLETRLAPLFHVGHISQNGDCETWHLARKGLFPG